MSASRKLYDPVKRALDVLAATVLLIVSLPIQLIVALLVAINLGRPVIFRQARPGKNGEIFTLMKFRSMKDVNEAKGLISNADRLTPFGRRLRATSLDELPSLLNVLRGDMSIVGPRPLLVRYLERYTPEQARRHEVRPGITGLAQANGRNAITWEQKFAFDVKYVDNRSFLLDLKILMKTLNAVFARTGIAPEGQQTMPEFMGSNPPEES